MPRAIWTGTISFGLVNVPVRMYSAIEEHDLHFHFVHEKDESRIGYQKVCKAEDRPVPDDEIVKAFEFEKDEFVIMEDEDFEAAKIEGYKTIDIKDFVPYEQIDPIYFERTYLLGPQDGGEKVYALLVEAMERSGLAAVAKYVMRDKQNLGCLRIRDGVLTLEKMYFADEIRPLEGVAPKRKGKVDERELEMAVELVDRLAGDFKPEKYEDTYREALCDVIKAKRKGRKPPKPKAEPERPVDLMEALRASLEASKKSRSKGSGSSRKRKAPAKKAA